MAVNIFSKLSASGIAGKKVAGIEFKVFTRWRKISLLNLPVCRGNTFRNICSSHFLYRLPVTPFPTPPLSLSLSLVHTARLTLCHSALVLNRDCSAIPGFFPAIFHTAFRRISHYFPIIPAVNFDEENGTESSEGPSCSRPQRATADLLSARKNGQDTAGGQIPSSYCPPPFPHPSLA